jgi:hypothetical protein
MEFIIIGIVVAIFAFFFAFPTWFKAHTRKKRAVDPDYAPFRPFAIVDELFRPNAHATQQVVESERVLPAKAPLPGDRP